MSSSENSQPQQSGNNVPEYYRMDDREDEELTEPGDDAGNDAGMAFSSQAGDNQGQVSGFLGHNAADEELPTADAHGNNLPNGPQCNYQGEQSGSSDTMDTTEDSVRTDSADMECDDSVSPPPSLCDDEALSWEKLCQELRRAIECVEREAQTSSLNEQHPFVDPHFMYSVAEYLEMIDTAMETMLTRPLPVGNPLQMANPFQLQIPPQMTNPLQASQNPWEQQAMHPTAFQRDFVDPGLLMEMDQAPQQSAGETEMELDNFEGDSEMTDADTISATTIRSCMMSGIMQHLRERGENAKFFTEQNVQKLVNCTEFMSSCIKRLNESLRHISASEQRRPGRRERVQRGGDIRCVMRSRGRPSPLRTVQNAYRTILPRGTGARRTKSAPSQPGGQGDSAQVEIRGVKRAGGSDGESGGPATRRRRCSSG